MSYRPDPTPAPKPDHIRLLRDQAANFVRAIDRTAFEFEGVASAELSERVASLVTLHELEGSELAKLTTEELRSRASLLRQAQRCQECADYEVRHMTTKELKKRIEYLRQFEAVKTLADISHLNDEMLVEVMDRVEKEAKARSRARKLAAKEVARFPRMAEVEDSAA